MVRGLLLLALMGWVESLGWLARRKRHLRSFAAARRYSDAPAIFDEDARPVVLFDGSCNLCNTGVTFMLDHDRATEDTRGNLRVAALQSNVGQFLLARLSPEDRARARDAATGEYKSIIVAAADRSWVQSSAILKIGRNLRGPLRWLALAGSLVPPPVLDVVYAWLSKRRASWFGTAAECRLYDDNYDNNFVPDAPVRAKGPLRAGEAVVVDAKEPVVVWHVPNRQKVGLCLNGLKGTILADLTALADRPYEVLVAFTNPTKFRAHLRADELALAL